VSEAHGGAKAPLSPETQVTKVSNTYYQSKKGWSIPGPVFHFKFKVTKFKKSIFPCSLQLHYLLGV